ncbi:putative quinol monooxygenase [Chryseobacterium sp. CCH4-E10]|uniref:putative quinol monooxygenase n=1 Tax=Chryseobacterium sp. CCH4-E10 TaxID=1768758 RepID=UPI00082F13AA|nr:antibiotic biosynthesis monooxygenase [Chryseobacterium sp. CCH4-E10]
MKKKTHQNPIAKQSPSFGKLLMPLIFLALVVFSCTHSKQQSNQMRKNNALKNTAKTETFQEIGFLGEVKKREWNSFLQAVRNNIMYSRREARNISFSLYQPVDGRMQPIWFERFKDKAAHNYHQEQDYFKNAITVIQQSLIGEAHSITLKVVDGLSATVPKAAHQPEDSRHVIVLFDVKPEKRTAFIDAMAAAAPLSRSAQGNLEFNLYVYADDTNKFVLVEGWQTVADHERQLTQDHIKRLNSTTKDFFVSNPLDTRWVLKDISQ